MGEDHASHQSLHSFSREIEVRKFELVRLQVILQVFAVELGDVGVVALLVGLTRDFPHGTVRREHLRGGVSTTTLPKTLRLGVVD